MLPDAAWPFLLGAAVGAVLVGLAAALLDARRSLRGARARLEREGNARRELVQLVNSAVHELKNPLSLLRFQLDEMALAGADPAAMARLSRAGEHLTRLVQDLAQATSLHGRPGVRRMRVDLARLARESAEPYVGLGRQAGIDVRIAAEGETPIDADPARMRQVVQNLVANAVKFTPRGGRVEVRVAAEGREALLSVTDTGAGLDADQMARLFAPFSRVHPDHPAPGTGLGLYVVRTLVQQHGGRAWAESAGPGCGATFHVALPRAD